MLAAIKNLTKIIERETCDINTEDLEESHKKTKVQESVVAVVFKPYAIEICKVLVEKCFDEFQSDDFVLNILEEILKLFCNFISNDEPQLILTILSTFSRLYLTKVTS
jgi:hypothetical protein